MPVGAGTIDGCNGDCHSSVAQSVRGMGWWWRPRQWVPNVNSGPGAQKYHAPPDMQSVLYTGKTNHFIHAVRFIHRKNEPFYTRGSFYTPEHGSFSTGKRFVFYRKTVRFLPGKRFVFDRKNEPFYTPEKRTVLYTAVRFIHPEKRTILYN